MGMYHRRNVGGGSASYGLHDAIYGRVVEIQYLLDFRLKGLANIFWISIIAYDTYTGGVVFLSFF